MKRKRSVCKDRFPTWLQKAPFLCVSRVSYLHKLIGPKQILFISDETLMRDTEKSLVNVELQNERNLLLLDSAGRKICCKNFNNEMENQGTLARFGSSMYLSRLKRYSPKKAKLVLYM